MLALLETLTSSAETPWQHYAACTVADIDRLDPILGGHPSPAELAVRTAAAQERCAHCPVAMHCGAEADRYGDEGVRGGSLRYRAGGPRGEYTVVKLIPNAVPSLYDRDGVAARLARKRARVALARTAG